MEYVVAVSDPREGQAFQRPEPFLFFVSNIAAARRVNNDTV